MKWLFFLFFFGILAADTVYFHPPTGWQMADPSQLSPHVQVLFMGKAENNFAPTVNLATEETQLSLKEYLKSVKEFHHTNPEGQWRDLGKFSLQCGEGRLTEITSHSPVGDIKMLQVLFVKNHTAYVVTAATLKSTFSQHQRELLAAIKSLTIVPHLFAGIDALQSTFIALGAKEAPDQEKQWHDWQQLLQNSYSYMGEHWHFLALKEGWARIHRESE